MGWVLTSIPSVWDGFRTTSNQHPSLGPEHWAKSLVATFLESLGSQWGHPRTTTEMHVPLLLTPVCSPLLPSRYRLPVIY